MEFVSFSDHINFMNFHGNFPTIELVIPIIISTLTHAWLLHSHVTKYLAQRYTV